jgi:hypothetical protein
MNASSLRDLLYHYFIQSRSLSLPGIGTFDLFRISAQTDFANRKILAPGYTISYDSINDAPHKDLFDYISRKRSIPEWEAIKEVNDFAFDIKQQLRSGQEVAWEGIGLLRAGVGGDIFFEPQSLQYSFINPVSATRVVRQGLNHPMLVGDRELGTHEMQDMLSGEDYFAREQEGWWVYAAILAAIAVLLIAARVFLGDHSLPSGRMDALRPATATETHTSPQVP